MYTPTLSLTLSLSLSLSHTHTVLSAKKISTKGRAIAVYQNVGLLQCCKLNW